MRCDGGLRVEGGSNPELVFAKGGSNRKAICLGTMTACIAISRCIDFQGVPNRELVLAQLRHHLPHLLRRFAFRVQCSGCSVQGAGCSVQGAGFRVQGSGFRVPGSGFRVQGSFFFFFITLRPRIE